ncbi:MAG: hypothetical protein CML46_13860 [Rhodobacteraceae bacterium]|nr:hypothetical protein [Paracoccaceae bacterium]
MAVSEQGNQSGSKPAGGGGYFAHVDGLRTIAVLGVLWAHFHVPGLPGGFLGVDVFFVISGYLITRLIIKEKLATGGFSYRRFYLRRVRRLLPAALATIALSLAAFFPILGEKDLISFLRSIPFAILPLANVNYYLEVGYFDTAAAFKPLLHFWSLSVEEQFYFIWPTALLMLLAFPRAVLPVTLALLAASVIAAQLWFDIDASATYYLLPFRAFELLIGAALAMVSVSHGERLAATRWASPLAILGMALVIFSYVVFDEASQLPGVLSLIVGVGTALLITFGAAGPVGRVLTWRPTVWIGLISYSLYLVHWPIIVYVASRLPDAPSIPLRVSLFAVSILFAALSYYLVERPFRHPAPAGRRFGNLPFLGATAVIAGLLVAPTAAYKIKLIGPTPPARLADAPAALSDVRMRYLPFPGSPDDRGIERFSIGAADAPRVLVLGDSHAGHLREGIRDYLAPRGLEVDLASVTGCPPLFGLTFQREEDKAPDPLCTRHAEAKRDLAINGDYDAVMLASRWNLAVGERELSTGRLRQIHLMEVGDADPALNVERSRELFDAALARTVEEILASGKRVVLLSQAPTTGVDLSQCLALFPWAEAARQGSARCAGLTSADARTRSDFADRELAEYAGREDVLVVRPIDFFCGGETCLWADPETGDFMYRDSNHLNPAGSLFLMDGAERESGLVEFLREARAVRDARG